MLSANKKFVRRSDRVRAKLSRVSDRLRLSVFKSNRHIYAQIIDDVSSRTMVSASSMDATIRQAGKSNCNIAIAKQVGNLLAEKAAQKNIDYVKFDKGGYKYHGVVKSLADAARSKLKF